MSVTIDNLRIDHRVTVIQAFTDTAGTSMHAGQSGILRGLSYDQIGGIIHIEIELEAGKVSLVSPLSTESGPRNGHMREFFDLGDYVPVPGTERVFHDPAARKMIVRKPIEPPQPDAAGDWDGTEPGLDGPDRLEDMEREMRRTINHIGVASSIAAIYRGRMRKFQLAGNEPRAAEAFKLAAEWMATYAGWATSGGEGVALSYERKQFHAALVREFGYDPTEAELKVDNVSLHDPAARKMIVPIVSNQGDVVDCDGNEPGMEGPDRLEDMERSLRRRIDHIGAASSIAEMYAGRMRMFQLAGNEPRAAAAFKLAVEWMATYAGSHERDQFHAALVREFGYDPTKEYP